MVSCSNGRDHSQTAAGIKVAFSRLEKNIVLSKLLLEIIGKVPLIVNKQHL